MAHRLGESDGGPELLPKPPPRAKSRCGRSRKWIKSAADEKAAADGCWFDEKLADHVVEWFETYLKHSKGQWFGKPFHLAGWQRDEVIKPLFGWVRPDRTRRFRRTYIEIPKKNGKSTLAAGVGLYLLLGDGERGSHVFSVASTRDQASIVHNEAIQMADSSDELRHFLRINRTNRWIEHRASASIYRSISADAGAQQGHDAHAMIMDELHVWRGRELWDGLIWAGKARRQPMVFVITTAGDDYDSICRQQHDYAQGILKGEMQDNRFFAYIRAADEGDDFDDPEVWAKANPSLGTILNTEDFSTDLTEAKSSPGAWAAFQRYSFNIWSTSQTRWLPKESWDKCEQEFTEEDLEGEPCWMGLDLASTQDTTSAVLVFRRGDDFLLLPHFWLPEKTAEQQKQLVNYFPWERKGYITLTPGNECDYGHIRDRVQLWGERYDLQEIAFDPWNAIPLIQALKDEDGFSCFQFRQTIQNFAAPTKEFERLVSAGRIGHNGHPVLSWQVGNTAVYTDQSGNKRPVKPREKDHRKIDGAVAAIMGLSRALVNEVQYAGPGVW